MIDANLLVRLAAHTREGSGDPHVVVAISGGVDSSVATLLLKESGLRISAIFMKNWNEPSEDGRCNWEDDVRDALDVCDRLDIPINTVDLSQAYWNEVFEDFVSQYRRGRTPNPDILCNREIKFKAFLEHARAVGGTMIATGHYARIECLEGEYRLRKGADPSKDQSYFLYTMQQHQLGATLFPIGDLIKTEVRRRARAAGLPTHAKKDSTGICFIGETRFRTFLGRYVPARPGDVRSTDGQVIGQHEGAAFYTLGQRQGLGIGGVKGAHEGPWFVVGKDLGANELIVAQGHDHPALLSRRVEADTLCWVAGTHPVAPYRCKAKTRYRQADQTCVIDRVDDDRVYVTFDSPQRAVTPGQSIVFYDNEFCLGGGIIDSTG